MKQYYFIPIEHEVTLATYINIWTSPPNNGWTIITGVYKKVESSIKKGNCLIKNVLRKDKLKQDIYYDIKNNDLSISLLEEVDEKLKDNKKEINKEKEKKELELIGFCLEGDLDLYTIEFKEQILQLSGVMIFNNNIDYLEWEQLK